MTATTVLNVSEERTRTKKPHRMVQNGLPTNELVFSAHVGGNEDIFPQILSLYVPKSSVIADDVWRRAYFGATFPI